MTEEQIIEFLTENMEYFVTNNLVTTILRTIGWGIVSLLNNVLNACRTLYDHTFGLIDITNWPVLQEFLEEYDPVIKAVLALSVVILGYMFFFGKNKQHDLMTSILIFTVVVTSSNYLFSTFNSLAVMFKDAVVGEEGTTDGYSLVAQNLYDLVYIDEQIGLENMSDSENPPQYGSLNEDDVRMIDITETLEYDKDGLTDSAKDILEKRIDYRYGANKLVDVYNGALWTDFANTFYYRYQFHYGTYYLSAIAGILVYLGLGYKNVRVIYELFQSRILVTLFSADLSSKRKAVQLVEGIRDGYYALIFTAITLRSYFLFTDYIAEQTAINGLERGIITLLLAFCVIDGANVMERITGIDAGLSSMAGKVIAGAHVLRAGVQTVQQARYRSAVKQQTKAMKEMGADRSKQEKDDRKENGQMTSDSYRETEHTTSGFEKNTEYTGNDETGRNGPENREETFHANNNYQSMENSAETLHQNNHTSSENMGRFDDVHSGTDGSEKGESATDKNFSRMNEELSGKSRQSNSHLKSEEGKHGNADKGMFDRWADKSEAGTRENLKSEKFSGSGGPDHQKSSYKESMEGKAGVKGQKTRFSKEITGIRKESGNLFHHQANDKKRKGD